MRRREATAPFVSSTRSERQLAGIADCRRSTDGSRRYLLELSDGGRIEAVDLPFGSRRTLCLSSQLGCTLACRFCATGLLPFRRNLSAEEIVAQARLLAAQAEGPVHNLVFMGMGEPFYNYESVIAAATELSGRGGLVAGPGRIAISTAGVLPQILRFFAEGHAFRLAISLFSAVEATRSQWMPINQRYPLEELRAALLVLPGARQKRIMLEIPLLAGVNDDDREAEALRRFCEGMRVRINLIAWNKNAAAPGARAPEREQILRYQNILRADGRPVFVRRSLGQDIDAACGQLAFRRA